MLDFEEIDRNLSVDEGGLIAPADGMALAERVNEWLDTPEGDLIDLPGWGNRLSRLKFEPPSADLDVMAEMLILEKLPSDVADISVVAASVQFAEIDRMTIEIVFAGGFVVSRDLELA
jgi:hypothetical protein